MDLRGFSCNTTRRESRGGCLLDPHLARAVPRHRVVVLVQRFFLLDTDRLRRGRLRGLGEVFPHTFVTLTVHLATNCLSYLHQGPSKIERVNDIAKVIQVRFAGRGKAGRKLTQKLIQPQTL